jgi:nitroimidazol reductase NimA-like FMN-containing flavoprotein (pyridoxamine 5'-phosphate oxidase superfamily)
MSAVQQPRRPMRRAEREITEPALILEVLQRATVLFLAFHDSPAPYVVPVCFGHENGTLYVHSAVAGTKIELLRANPLLGFSASTDMVVVPGQSACDFSSRARSVVGTGRARIVESQEERGHGLDLIMRHYSTGPVSAAPVYRPDALARTCVLAISILSMSGKKTG